ncbi:MAG TPA: tyrosine--tRNA ligase [Clostridiales bacterium]|nr:tyrosine--tRNA ligase [Clostridiales bacterium]
MANIMDVLRERGFVKQTVYEEELYEKLGKESVPFYIGFDPTADSLHVGHFLTLIAMHHMQQAGHKPIILIGGGTAMIGDPSGRTDMRQMMTKETIAHNVECFKKQMSRFIDFEGENGAIVVNNADWLLDLNYVDFLRDIGAHFSVNKMLTAECFKQRLERGLSFLEFNYMLMQAYDFLVLNRKYGCALELGGDDQWSNILAGANLIRIKERKPAYAMTFTLLTTSDGRKMGKTAKGAVWLDENKTTPYEFYQYWRNIDDADVEKCLKLLTFLPVSEIDELCSYRDERINHAKEVLAFELTKEVHGEEKAKTAQEQAKAAFAGGDGEMLVKEAAGAQTVVDAMVAAGVCKSKGEARRLIEQGGVSVNDEKVTDANMPVPAEEFVLQKGKKVRVKISVK